MKFTLLTNIAISCSLRFSWKVHHVWPHVSWELFKYCQVNSCSNSHPHLKCSFTTQSHHNSFSTLEKCNRSKNTPSAAWIIYLGILSILSWLRMCWRIGQNQTKAVKQMGKFLPGRKRKYNKDNYEIVIYSQNGCFCLQARSGCSPFM